MKPLGLSIALALVLGVAAARPAAADDVIVKQEASVPEPSSLLLFGIGTIAVGLGLRRRKVQD